MAVSAWIEATCDQCGKQAKKKSSGGYWADRNYTPRGWISVFSKLLCGWKCVAAYANEQATKPKAPPRPKKKRTVKKAHQPRRSTRRKRVILR